LTVTSLGEDQIRVNVVPKKLADSETAALSTPMSLVEPPPNSPHNCQMQFSEGCYYHGGGSKERPAESSRATEGVEPIRYAFSG
jgi:hypothetical protein